MSNVLCEINNLSQWERGLDSAALRTRAHVAVNAMSHGQCRHESAFHDELSDSAWRNAVIGRFDFDATIQMHKAFTVLGITEWFDRQGSNSGSSSAKIADAWSFHECGYRPNAFAVVQVRLSFLENVKSESLQWCFLSMADARFDFPFPIRIVVSGMARRPRRNAPARP
jgi:hypothetical protein